MIVSVGSIISLLFSKNADVSINDPIRRFEKIVITIINISIEIQKNSIAGQIYSLIAIIYLSSFVIVLININTIQSHAVQMNIFAAG
jgi:hypothetical protein